MQKDIKKEQLQKSGVYKITNCINGKFYIGSTKSFILRYRSHLSSLSRGKSGSRILQNAVIKYGIINFIFSIVEDCENYEEREVYYIEKLKPNYNIILEKQNRREFSDESRKRMSDSRKGVPSPLKGTKRPNYKRNKKQIVIYKNNDYTIQQLSEELKCSVQAIYQRIKRKTLLLKTD